MNYLSVCSGIEAASVAWHGLGWEPVGFSEIEPFPAAVLAHHFPHVENLGDMTKFKEWNIERGSIDLMVGGTPCQAFSVAGLRGGLKEPRGNLMLTYGAIADHLRPRWIVWENVPGVLSSNGGRDFGAFLGMLGQLGYGFAYRVLDAQYVRVESHRRAVPQRRRRVFVVGYLGDWRRAASVLFESESMCRYTPPSRKAGAGTSGSTPHGIGDGGEVARALTACNTATGRLDPNEMTFLSEISAPALTASGRGVELVGETRGQDPVIPVAHTLKGEGFDASEDGTGRGTPIIPQVCGTLQNSGRAAGSLTQQDAEAGMAVVQPVADTLTNCFHKHHGASGGKDSIPRNHVVSGYSVRRLTPEKCERLQGFSTGWTKIPWRKKVPEDCPDGPRYKAIGNSMATNVMRWIGTRVEKEEKHESF